MLLWLKKARDWQLRAGVVWAQAKVELSDQMATVARHYAAFKGTPWEESVSAGLGRIALAQAKKLKDREASLDQAISRERTWREGVLGKALKRPKGSASQVWAMDLGIGLEGGDCARLNELLAKLSDAPSKAWKEPSSIDGHWQKSLTRADAIFAFMLEREPGPQALRLASVLAKSQALGLEQAARWAYSSEFRLGARVMGEEKERIEINPHPAWREAMLGVAQAAGNSTWEAVCLESFISTSGAPLPPCVLKSPLALPLALLSGSSKQAEQAMDASGLAGFPLAVLACLGRSDEEEKLRMLSRRGVDLSAGVDWQELLSDPGPWLDFCAAGQSALTESNCFSALPRGEGDRSAQDGTRPILESLRRFGRENVAGLPDAQAWAQAMWSEKPWGCEPKIEVQAQDEFPWLWPGVELRAAPILFFKNRLNALRVLREISPKSTHANWSELQKPAFSLAGLDEASACGWVKTSEQAARWWMVLGGFRKADFFVADEQTLVELRRCEEAGWLDDPQARQAMMEAIESGCPERARAARWLLEWNEEAFDPPQRERLRRVWRAANEVLSDNRWIEPEVLERLKRMRLAREQSHEMENLTQAAPSRGSMRI